MSGGRRVGASTLLAVLLLAPGCATNGAADTALTVAAASSLTEVFTDLAPAFERRHDDRVTFTFDSSAALAGQIVEGAPVDVFAAADEATMARVVDAGLVDGAPRVFARNQLAIVTKPGNPLSIGGVADLRGAAERGFVALCDADAPCGALADQVLRRAGVELPEVRVTRAQNARATLTAVSEGDAVAGLVFVTDARASGPAVTTVAIPSEQNALAQYSIAVLAGALPASVAEAFVAFVLGPDGRAALEASGFLPPP